MHSGWFWTVADSGLVETPPCVNMSHYIYFRKVTCNEWISDDQEWTSNICQVV